MPQGDYDIQLALELSDMRHEKAAIMLGLPLFRIARGDELDVVRNIGR